MGDEKICKEVQDELEILKKEYRFGDYNFLSWKIGKKIGLQKGAELQLKADNNIRTQQKDKYMQITNRIICNHCNCTVTLEHDKCPLCQQYQITA